MRHQHLSRDSRAPTTPTVNDDLSSFICSELGEARRNLRVRYIDSALKVAFSKLLSRTNIDEESAVLDLTPRDRGGDLFDGRAGLLRGRERRNDKKAEHQGELF